MIDNKGNYLKINKWLEQATISVASIHKWSKPTDANRMINEAYNAGIQASKGKTCFYAGVTTTGFSDDQCCLMEGISNYFKGYK